MAKELKFMFSSFIYTSTHETETREKLELSVTLDELYYEQKQITWSRKVMFLKMANF